MKGNYSNLDVIIVHTVTQVGIKRCFLKHTGTLQAKRVLVNNVNALENNGI